MSGQPAADALSLLRITCLYVRGGACLLSIEK